VKTELTPRIDHFSAADGYRIFVRVWDTAKPVARVVCLHGIISHAGWYSKSCQKLAEAGYEVHFMDRRGAGLNVAARGDVDRYETWLQDTEIYLGQLTATVPRILLGISWGGKLAAAVARHRPDLVDGLGLLCPGIFARRGATWMQRAAIQLAGRSKLRTRRVSIPLQDPALFTASRHWQEVIASDPLAVREITIRLALADLRLTRWATKSPESIHAPTLLMLAGQDRIIDNQRVREFVDGFGCPTKQMIEYPDAGHTLEFEPDTSTFLCDLGDWLGGIVARRRS
jgi:alpha-beta hydrolase superfamily lysophospholipase